MPHIRKQGVVLIVQVAHLAIMLLLQLLHLLLEHARFTLLSLSLLCGSFVLRFRLLVLLPCVFHVRLSRLTLHICLLLKPVKLFFDIAFLPLQLLHF
jgi:hypothetical protein